MTKYNVVFTTKKSEFSAMAQHIVQRIMRAIYVFFDWGFMRRQKWIYELKQYECQVPTTYYMKIVLGFSLFMQDCWEHSWYLLMPFNAKWLGTNAC